ncbi:MAG: MFS transporter [Pontibacterium sp.]
MSFFAKYVDRLHNLIDDEFEARSCKDIDEGACKVVPGNAFLMTLSLVLSKVADTLASAKIVLPWLMATTGAPTFLISLLVPIRESGSMLPQLWLGAYIRLKPIRKRYLVIGAILQAFMLAGLVLVAPNLTGMAAGIAIVVLTALFSLARAILSIANKDVLGKTIPKQQRGRLSGTAASIAGLLCGLVGVALMLGWVDQGGISYLLIMATVGFTLCGLTYGLIKEFAGATEGGVNAVEHAVKNLSLLKDDKHFARFVCVRALMVSSGLAAPYFVLMAHADSDSSLSSLGLLILVSGAASFVSGSIWGRLADRNSKSLMSLTAGLNGIVCLAGAVLASAAWAGMGVEGTYFYLGLFFVVSVIHEGVRQARKTYIVDMAGGNKRTDYVSVSNTLIGVLLLFVGVVSGIVAQFSLVAVMVLFALCSLAALLLSAGLKSVSD